MKSLVHDSVACVAVFEKEPYWGPELKRQFIDQRILVHECRSVRDLIPAITQYSSAVILMNFDASPVDCLGWLTRDQSAPASVPRILIASNAFLGLEWLIRETGATYLSDETARASVARVCLRALNLPTTPVAGLKGG